MKKTVSSAPVYTVRLHFRYIAQLYIYAEVSALKSVGFPIILELEFTF